ncbi:hypothetical protein VTN02DRAFT_4359 [Thermoascus thermophilus]
MEFVRGAAVGAISLCYCVLCTFLLTRPAQSVRGRERFCELGSHDDRRRSAALVEREEEEHCTPDTPYISPPPRWSKTLGMLPHVPPSATPSNSPALAAWTGVRERTGATVDGIAKGKKGIPPLGPPQPRRMPTWSLAATRVRRGCGRRPGLRKALTLTTDDARKSDHREKGHRE